MINAQILQGHWNEIKGILKQHWGDLTGDDLRRSAATSINSSA